MRDRFWIWSGLFLVVAAALARAAGGPPAAQAGRSARTVRIEACTVKLLEEVVLSCERPGILGSVLVKEGDVAGEGQLLATIKDDVAKAALAVAEAEAESDVEVRFAQAASGVAQLEHERMVEANRRVPQTVPEIEVRKAELAARKTALEVEKAEQTLKIHQLKRDEAAVQLATYRVEAPFFGFVRRVHLLKGAAVKQGDPIIELVSTKKVKVEADVKVPDLALVRVGSKVSVQLDASDVGAEAARQSFPGKIMFVDVKATSVDHKVRVWAEVENVENMLRAGLTATMTIFPLSNE
jgi:multidrug efflux pump subunit AcrA (membrane-fusion protein)